MPRVPNREELQEIIRALLLTRKEALTTGIPIAQLDNDYRNLEGTRIPFREFGHSCLLDFLQTLTGGLVIRSVHGMRHVFPIVDEKIKHVSDMVAGQKDSSKRITRGGRRQTRSPSPWYPRVIQPPVRLDYRTLAEVVKLVQQSPGGIHFDYIHNYACGRMNYNIGAMDLSRQLSEISHEIILDHNVLYPVTQHPRVSHFRDQNATAATTGVGVKSQKEVRDSSEGNDEDVVSTTRHTARNDMPKNQETNDSCRESGRTSKELHGKAEETNYHDDETMKNTGTIEKSSGHDRNENFATQETISELVTLKTRIRLEMLIRKYPDGIWCAELPDLYKKEYTIPLNYEEIGFGSVSDFASHLPDIFYCVQPQEGGDFKLFDAKSGKPDVKQTRRTVLTTAALHNIYKYESDAIPSILSKETAARLIPDGVVTPGETVGQICVTELDRGIHEYIDVVVVDVFTPSFFWIHLRKKTQIFRRFMDDLHEFYERNFSKYVLPIAVMERGLNCACLYDGRWHRAIIKAVQPDNSITVLFYDYGTVGTYAPERIYFLHRSFSNLPAQAIPCGLYNVKPVGTQKWSRSITVEFLQKVSNIPLVATIAHIDTNNNSMMVGLTNTDGDEDFHINDWMVQAGYATYGKMVCIGPRNFPYQRYLQCKSLNPSDKVKDRSSCDLKNVDEPTRDKVVKINSRGPSSNGWYSILLKLRLKSGENSPKLLITKNMTNTKKRQEDSHFFDKSESQTDKDRGGDNVGTNNFPMHDPRTRHDGDLTPDSRVNKSGPRFLRELRESFRRNQSLSSISNSGNNLDELKDRTYNAVPSISTDSSTVDLRNNEFSRDEEETSNLRIQAAPLHLTMPKTEKIFDEFGALHGRFVGQGRMESISWSSIKETMKNEEKTNRITVETKRESIMKKQSDKVESPKLPETTKALWDIDNENETLDYMQSQDQHSSGQMKIVEQTHKSSHEIDQVSIEKSPPQFSSSPKLPRAKRALWNLAKSQREKKISVVDKIDDRDEVPAHSEILKKEDTSAAKLIESSLTIPSNVEKNSKKEEKAILEFGKFHSTLGGNGRMESVTWSELRKIINSPEETYEVATETISLNAKSRKSMIPSNLPKAEKTFLKIIGHCALGQTTNLDSTCVPEGNIRMGKEVTPFLRTLKNKLGNERNERVRVFIPNEVLEFMKDNGESENLSSSDYSSDGNRDDLADKTGTKSTVHETRISSESLLEMSESSNSRKESLKPNDPKDSLESIGSADKDRQGKELNDHSSNSMREIVTISSKNESSITEMNHSLSPETKKSSPNVQKLSSSPTDTSPGAKCINTWLQSVYVKPTSEQLSKLIETCHDSTNDSVLDSDDLSVAEEVKYGKEKNYINDNNSPSPTKSWKNEVSRKTDDHTTQESQKIHDSLELQENKYIDSTKNEEDPKISKNHGNPDSIDAEELANVSKFLNSDTAKLSVIKSDETAVQSARNVSKISPLINDLDLNTDDDYDKWDFSPGWFGTTTDEILENVAKVADSVSLEHPSALNKSKLATISSCDESSLDMSDNFEATTTVSGSSRDESDTDTQPDDNKYCLIDDISSDTDHSARPSTGTSPLIKLDVTIDNYEPRESPSPNYFSIDNERQNDSDENHHLHDETLNCKPDETLLDKPTANVLTEEHYSILSEIKKSKILNISNDAFVHFDDSSSGEKTNTSYKSSLIGALKRYL